MLDAYQKRAVFSKSKDLLITAPAGSGKTRVLIERVARLVGDHSARPEQILVLTFARKAAAEIRTRFKDKGLARVEALTFHAWAYRLARSIHTSSFELINESQRERVLRRICVRLLSGSEVRQKTRAQIEQLNWSLTYLVTELISVLQILRQFGWTADKTRQAIEDKKINWEFNDLLLRLWDSYEWLCAKRQTFDFNLLISYAEKYLLAHEVRLARTRSRYRHILVDEVQDANGQELSLINLIRGQKSSLTFVGDLNQAIYTWRGAHLPPDLKERVVLKNNYRSDKKIISLINDFYGLKIESTRPAQVKPVCIYHQRYAEARVLKRLLKELSELGYVTKDVLILARAHNPLQQIKDLKKEFRGLRLATVHAVKGLEARVVILINCSQDRFGFPLPDNEQAHPLLGQLAKYDQSAEEKRIFYVAMTRARERLILLTDERRPSPYLREMSKKYLKYVNMHE